MGVAGSYQPLNVWHAYETCLRLYFRNLPALLMATAVAVVPSYAFLALVQSATIPDVLAESYGGPFWSRTRVPAGDVPSDEMAGYLVGLGLGGIVVAVGIVLATTACCHIVTEAWHGRKPSWRDGWQASVVGRRVPALLWLSFIGGLLLLVGLALCILPGIWLAVAWSVAIPALMFEGARGTAALERSFRLTRRRWWPTFGGLLLVTTTGSILGLPFSLPAAFLPAVVDDFFIASAIGGTLNIFSAVVSTPLTAGIITIFFFDLRARHTIAAAPATASARQPPQPPQPPPPPPPSWA